MSGRERPASSGSDPYAPPRRRRRVSARRRFSPWLSLLASTAGALGIGLFVAGTNPYTVPSASMRPALQPGDLFRADVYFALRQGPKRGEIWVFNNPQPENHLGAILVKRIVGLPGERISVVDGQIRVNGQVIKEQYQHDPIGYRMKPVRLRPDEYWVLGDNRNDSADSHVWGPLNRRTLQGRAWLRYWPPTRLGLL